MKRILLSIAALITIGNVYSQTLKASLGLGNTSNSVRIFVRPDITNPAVAISTLSFNVAIPAGITPVPTLSLVTNNIAGVVWLIEAPYTEGGYIHYNIYNNQSLYTLNCSAGVEIPVMDLAFTGGPAGSFTNTAHLVTLPDGGGGNGLALFYCTSAVGGVLNSNGQDLYYARDGNVVFANGDSYRYTPPGEIGQRGTFTSYARFTPGILLSGGTVPVTFTGFDAKCSDKGTIVTWSTATEQNSDRFEIERSDNGVDWYKIGTVAAAGNSTSNRSYKYLDLKGGEAFYRLRQVDIDGRFTVTNIRRTNCKAGQFDVVLYPVPAKDNLTVVISSDKSIRTDLLIVDMNGRTVRRVPTQINNGNNTIQLNVSDLSAGQYLLSSSDPTLELNKKFTVIR